ncbi:hypothetical protein [Burkholderia sp. D-99]|uniref:hypothetical protein n=1 Tax=Burkholderia sp. D-99 TaxID=2717316 RepID=UPI0014232646|nr:hypothetical protein [Burkholderia sp. D-99]NHV28219.1 hypothetical protein [Burkholderia sp. D-99]
MNGQARPGASTRAAGTPGNRLSISIEKPMRFFEARHAISRNYSKRSKARDHSAIAMMSILSRYFPAQWFEHAMRSLSSEIDISPICAYSNQLFKSQIADVSSLNCRHFHSPCNRNNFCVIA